MSAGKTSTILIKIVETPTLGVSTYIDIKDILFSLDLKLNLNFYISV
jgi:hypothetical protein